MLSLPVALIRGFHHHHLHRRGPLLNTVARLATRSRSSVPSDGSEKKVRRPRAAKAASLKKDGGVALRVSDLAAIVGRNAYKSSDEVFKDMHLRYSPQTFTGVTRGAMLQMALDKVPSSVKNAVYSTISHKAAHSQVTRECLAA